MLIWSCTCSAKLPRYGHFSDLYFSWWVSVEQPHHDVVRKTADLAKKCSVSTSSCCCCCCFHVFQKGTKTKQPWGDRRANSLVDIVATNLGEALSILVTWQRPGCLTLLRKLQKQNKLNVGIFSYIWSSQTEQTCHNYNRIYHIGESRTIWRLLL